MSTDILNLQKAYNNIIREFPKTEKKIHCLYKTVLEIIDNTTCFILNSQKFKKYHKLIKNASSSSFETAILKIAKEISSKSAWIFTYSDKLVEYVHAIWVGKTRMKYKGLCQHIYKQVISNEPELASFSDCEFFSRKGITTKKLAGRCNFETNMWGYDTGLFDNCNDAIIRCLLNKNTNNCSLSTQIQCSYDELDEELSQNIFEFSEVVMKFLCYCWGSIKSHRKQYILLESFNRSATWKLPHWNYKF